ncbi:hypothetical protein KORDIASMS9_04340 [Kordia sp. SMS9]|uniref:hypothetical protein n=1 Tax=Kordia sp. SMS9 TaxID=2282170 RepID=UPI000E0D042F|nr:hypothetical protein [Kordia sp. SMS9]AXG72078.1 hypothetical protein KORDIASMS9_04340 [Kordia sp. SMS9]
MGKPNLVIDREQEKVFLDGEVIGSIEINDPDLGFYLLFEEVDKLSGIKMSDIFGEKIFATRILFEDNFYYKWDFIFTSYTSINFTDNEISHVNIHLNMDNWNFQYGIHSFFKRLTKSLDDNELVYINEEEQFENFQEVIQLGLNIYLTSDVWLRDIFVVHKEITELLNVKIENVFFELTKSPNQRNLTNTFTFPPEIQTSCEQYLIYFATFLKDIGINAETNIESKAHETLFTVIPKDGEEALDKIKEALQIYLHLPESPEFESAASEFTDMSVQKLASQVYFYKSQLALASTMLQLKDKQIESLNMTIYQQESSVEVQVIEEKNEEKILGGLVTITEFKLNGITVNSPEMVRFLKRVFRSK